MIESNKIDIVLIIKQFDNLGVKKEIRKEALSVFGDTERVETYYYQGLDAKHIEIEVIGYVSFNISTDFYADLFKFEEVFQSLLYQGVIEYGNGNVYNINNFTVKVI
ncbi:hypothetical protein MOD25_05320 [Bacillus haynesii]|uniref:hypothetical protein n=1 Tax=Bacillus haynesii TaxID=1925021 RepID=UPI00227F52FD|nr:hypothetical protein [Bacillus haynesii]MCY8549320.1 hypothetical protein [Bacillus haynesii]